MNTSDAKELRELWRLGFDDSPAWIDAFYRCHPCRRSALFLRDDDGRIASALYMLPFELRDGERLLSAVYIFAVTTRPELRGRGWMHRLMECAHALLQRRQHHFSFLVPASPGLWPLYEGMGYRPLFYYTRERVVPGLVILPADCRVERAKRLTAELSRFFRKCERRRTRVLLHRRRDVRLCLLDACLDGEPPWLLRRCGCIVALAFVAAGDEGVAVRELLASDDDTARLLLGEVARRMQVSSLWLYRPSCRGEVAVPHGLGRSLQPCVDVGELAEGRPFMSLMFDDLKVGVL